MSKYRMYSLVLRQLSPIQKGVQSAHSIVEYCSKFDRRSEFIQWVHVDKTIIVLDGGTYNDMRECENFLSELKVPYTVFYEEDLNNLLTSISFIVDDKVWDDKTYPTFDDIDLETSDSDDIPAWLNDMGGIRNYKLRNFLKKKRLSN